MARQQVLADALKAANDKQMDVSFESAQMGRTPLEKQFAQIQENARKAALEAGRAFSATFEGEDLSAAQAEEPVIDTRGSHGVAAACSGRQCSLQQSDCSKEQTGRRD